MPITIGAEAKVPSELSSRPAAGEKVPPTGGCQRRRRGKGEKDTHSQAPSQPGESEREGAGLGVRPASRGRTRCVSPSVLVKNKPSQSHAVGYPGQRNTRESTSPCHKEAAPRKAGVPADKSGLACVQQRCVQDGRNVQNQEGRRAVTAVTGDSDRHSEI